MDADWSSLLKHPALALSRRRDPFTESLAQESDRGCAVLALCVLEDVAKEAIRRRIGVFGDMLPVLCPQGGWRVIAQSLCLLGLISRHERGDLKKLIGIRNDFAHKAVEDLSFDTREIASRVDQLKLAGWYWTDPKPQSRRHLFLLTVQLMHTVISNRGGNAAPMEPCAEFFVIPDEWKEKFD